MGYMKWIWGLMDTGGYQQLEYEYIKAVQNKAGYVLYDNTYLDLNFADNVLKYIKKLQEEEQQFKEQYGLSNNEESESDRLQSN